MKKELDRTIKTSYTYLTSHIEKLKNMSKETYVPVSALIRKALNEFFDKYEKIKK